MKKKSKRRSTTQFSRWLVLSLICCLCAIIPVGNSVLAKEGCIDCHSNPDLIVTNKKLFDYYREWRRSIHKEEDVTCSDCHGGNPDASSKKTAHGGAKGTRKMMRAVSFQNIPETCGQCHDDILVGYTQSNHFKHLKSKNQVKQGPNCVTCHGSLNSVALNVNTVSQTCQVCHNQISRNNPDIPKKAEWLLNKFLSTHRLFRYVSIKSSSADDRAFLKKAGIQMEALSEEWHTFDLKLFEQKTRRLLDDLKNKRNEIRKRIRTSHDD
ncbi:MAG: hypothetical protein HN945_02085 [Deltaproteobacteria bacterium]|nr:hypothetical protein [Deltaproteobacteria bacterium]